MRSAALEEMEAQKIYSEAAVLRADANETLEQLQAQLEGVDYSVNIEKPAGAPAPDPGIYQPVPTSSGVASWDMLNAVARNTRAGESAPLKEEKEDGGASEAVARPASAQNASTKNVRAGSPSGRPRRAKAA